MHLAESLIAKIRAGYTLGFDLTADNIPCDFANSGDRETAYPPPGYLPFDVLAVGNGDTYGFYWPVGKENSPPFVVTTMHDGWFVFPVASSFERAIRLLYACQFGRDEEDDADECESEIESLAKQFQIDLSDLPILENDDSVFFFEKPASALLKIDDSSPGLLRAAALEARALGDLVAAEEHVTRATQLFPEYSDAWDLLARIRQQNRNLPGFIEAALRALSTPFSFGARNRIELLTALQGLPDSACSDANDPIWVRRKLLTFTDDFYKSPDLPLLSEAVGEFQAAHQDVRAIHLQLTIGDLMGFQDCFLIREYQAGHTTAFHDRSRLRWKSYRAALRHAHITANLDARLAVL